MDGRRHLVLTYVHSNWYSYLRPGSYAFIDDIVPIAAYFSGVKGEQPDWLMNLLGTRIHARSHGPEEGVISGHGRYKFTGLILSPHFAVHTTLPTSSER